MSIRLDGAPARITRADYDRMVDRGELEGGPVELLEGRIVEMSPQGPQHSAVLSALLRVLRPDWSIVRVQMPLAASADSEPEPDLALVAHDDPAVHPATADLVVEIAVTMLREARAKTPLYAAAGVPEYWIVDVPARAVEVLSGPGPAGYARSRILRGADELVARPVGRTTTVAELFAVAGLPPH